MSSEWMKVMLEEIARKKAEAEESRLEEQKRADEHGRGDDRRRGQAKYAGCDTVREVRPREKNR